MQQAHKGLASTEIAAPHDGIFIIERDWRGNLWKVGDSVWPGLRLASLPLLDEMEVEAFVLEADAGGLRSGCPRASCSRRSRAWSTRLPSRTSTSSPSRASATCPSTTSRSSSSLERTDKDRMKPGQRARVTLAARRSARRSPCRARPCSRRTGGRSSTSAAAASRSGRSRSTCSSPGLVVIATGAGRGRPHRAARSHAPVRLARDGGHAKGTPP